MCRQSPLSHVGPWSTGVLGDQYNLHLFFIYLLVWSPRKQRMTPCYCNIGHNNANDGSWFTYCWPGYQHSKNMLTYVSSQLPYEGVSNSLPFPDEDTEAQKWYNSPKIQSSGSVQTKAVLFSKSMTITIAVHCLFCKKGRSKISSPYRYKSSSRKKFKKYLAGA